MALGEEFRNDFNYLILRILRYNGSIGLANFKEYKNWLEIAVQNNILADSSFAFDLRNG